MDPEVFAEYGEGLPDPLRRRAAHYFGEMRRVGEGVAAWERGDLERFGALVSESGASSIENYECGTPAMVSLFETLVEQPGVFGARFSGAGFGGSCLALVRNDAVNGVVSGIFAATGQTMSLDSSSCGSDGRQKRRRVGREAARSVWRADRPRRRL